MLSTLIDMRRTSSVYRDWCYYPPA
ncbi:hypothetical protein PIIN_11292 [Serendipita indica DSM 11827]|uniref:Uncharacterized protein n=1 Tax=Serendipita indica (strain DSM 11827) TaxID=1109443 RepID=G4U172_SERID|nr:hypothetical protein PIIN_11292 [Serendipita indica DSM 11827]